MSISYAYTILITLFIYHSRGQYAHTNHRRLERPNLLFPRVDVVATGVQSTGRALVPGQRAARARICQAYLSRLLA